MTTYTFLGATKGAPDNSQNTLLHTYRQTLASGARVAQGDGTGLGLVVWEDAIGVINAGGFVAKILSSATAERVLTLPDTSGTVVLGNGAGITDAEAFRSGFGERTVKLAADITTTSTTPVAVAGMSFALETNAVYQLRAFLITKTAEGDRGVQPSITGPAGSIDSIYGHCRTRGSSWAITDINTSIEVGGHDGSANPELMTLDAVIQTNGVTPASELGLSFESENGVQVELKAGSAITLKKL